MLDLLSKTSRNERGLRYFFPNKTMYISSSILCLYHLPVCMYVLGDRSGSGGMYKPSSKFLPDKKEETPALVKPPPTPNQKPVVGVHFVTTV